MLGSVASAQGQYREAYQRYAQSLAVADAAGDQAGKAIALTSLGDVTCSQGEHTVSEHYYRRALEIAHDIQRTPVMLSALVGLASLMLHTGQRQEAVEMLAVTLDHPALDDTTHEQAERLRIALAPAMSVQQLAAAHEDAKKQPLPKFVKALLLKTRTQATDSR